jgi:uncharacterized membrane protein YfcA
VALLDGEAIKQWHIPIVTPDSILFPTDPISYGPNGVLFAVLTVIAGIAGGAIAAVSGFGIGSLLTPLLSVRLGTRLAVAAVAGPHLLGTAIRLWRLRKFVDRQVLVSFGVLSAVGGLLGALAHSTVASPLLRIVFGGLLVFTGVMGLTGLVERMRFGRRTAWLAGFVSGALGGLAGTQGGIRAAALMGFNLTKNSFVAVSTATGLIVDLARGPVYIATQWQGLKSAGPLIALAAVGVVIGTLLGERLLRRIPEALFRRIVSALILLLGLSMMWPRPLE